MAQVFETKDVPVVVSLAPFESANTTLTGLVLAH